MSKKIQGDIVDILRCPVGGDPPGYWHLKAADEIERLREQIVRLKAKRDVVPSGSYLGRQRS